MGTLINREVEDFSSYGYIYAVMDDLQTVRQASELTGTDRKSIARWLKLGLLKGKPTKMGHLIATLVSVKAVKELAKTRRPGRPRKAVKSQ
jgi:hypothetical protein